jgi:hypothetical protein
MMNKNIRHLLENSGYIKTKRGLIEYLHDRDKLPFVSSFYSVTVEHYMKQSISELEKYI